MKTNEKNSKSKKEIKEEKIESLYKKRRELELNLGSDKVYAIVKLSSDCNHTPYVTAVPVCEIYTPVYYKYYNTDSFRIKPLCQYSANVDDIRIEVMIWNSCKYINKYEKNTFLLSQLKAIYQDRIKSHRAKLKKYRDSLYYYKNNRDRIIKENAKYILDCDDTKKITKEESFRYAKAMYESEIEELEEKIFNLKLQCPMKVADYSKTKDDAIEDYAASIFKNIMILDFCEKKDVRKEITKNIVEYNTDIYGLNNMRRTIKEDSGTYSVYCHTSPSNKKYIGITIHKEVNRRWQNGDGYKSQTKFYNAIKKYGWDNFTHEILKDGLSEKAAKIFESYYIKHFNTIANGYNVLT